jgi:integrase
LATKHVTAHLLRHTAAMRLLEAGIDTTAVYLDAHLDIKEKALAATTPPNITPGRYRPPDDLLAFLEGL